MRFQITMNMPARSGNSVHQIIAEHPARDLTSFIEMLSESDFIIVDELYRDDKVPRDYPGHYTNQGALALNPLFIGKVKVMR